MFSCNNEVVQKDLQELVSEPIQWDKLRNKSVLITGATGMLATYVVYTLAYLNEVNSYNIKILALARSPKKVMDRFEHLLDGQKIKVIYQDVCSALEVEDSVDYVFHLAGGASPSAILTDPVGIIQANTVGLINILELANRKRAKVLFASTREVYGAMPSDITLIKEDSAGVLDTQDQRSCYPGSKRMAETLCKSYSVQYGVPFVIMRIAHTYGPGMNIINDGRVMSDLIADIVNDRDIALNSAGDAIRAFCYITDAVKGCFIAILSNKENEVYNLANETEPVSILALANLLVTIKPEKQLKVTYRESTEKERAGYTKFARVALDTSKLEGLGWNPSISLRDGVTRTINSYR